MVRVIETTLYAFDELSDEAKEQARDWYRNAGDCWGWASDWIASAQAFERIAPIKIRGWDIERGNVNVEWSGPDYACRYDHSDAIGELSGLRAWKWLQNNDWFKWAHDNKQGACNMTGYCGDCPFGDAIAAYADKPLSVPDLEQVFYEACQAWVYAARDDLEHSYSDESVDEHIRINEYEFTAEGDAA
jgi:hypothetical protein